VSIAMCGYRLPLHRRSELRSSGLLHGKCTWFVQKVSRLEL
jgi:hypothetical protein